MLNTNTEAACCAREFVHGFILGSCNPWITCVTYFLEELTARGIVATEEEADEFLAVALDDNGVFCCECCGWYCDESERSPNDSEENNCTDCSPEWEE